MQKYFDDVADKNGKPVTGATVLVLNYPAGTTATIYADNSFTALANPISTDTNGGFAFYARDGRYSLQINGPGLATRTINDILLEDPVDGGSPGSFTTLTVATSGTLAGSAIQTLATLASSGSAANIGSMAGNVQSDLNARPTNASLAAPGSAANIGTAAGTVQTDINARPTSSSLAASGGAANIGESSGTTVEDRLKAINLADYTALRAYAGASKRVRVTGYLATSAPAGIAGDFVVDDTDTTSADNGGTIIVASNGKRWKRSFTGPVMAAWFGASSSASATVNTAAIQATVDYAIYRAATPIGRVVLPDGALATADTIQLGYGTSYTEITLEGGGSPYDGETPFGGTVLLPNFSDRPAINVQGARRARIRRLALVGLNNSFVKNNNLGGVSATTDDTAASAWADPSLNANATSRYAPYAGITVDAYAGAAPSPSYPAVNYPAFLGAVSQYNKNYSSNIVIEDCWISGFVAGVAIQPGNSDGNGDFVSFRDTNIAYCVYGVSVGQSQSREVNFYNGQISNCHTALTNNKHGKQIGKFGGVISGTAIESVIQIFDVIASFCGPMLFEGCYGELVWRLGNTNASAATSYPITFSGCEWQLISHPAIRGVPELLVEGGGCPVIFRGGALNLPSIGSAAGTLRLDETLVASNDMGGASAGRALAQRASGGLLSLGPLLVADESPEFRTNAATGQIALSKNTKGGGRTGTLGRLVQSVQFRESAASYAPIPVARLVNSFGTASVTVSLTGISGTIDFSSQSASLPYGLRAGDLIQHDQTGTLFLVTGNTGLVANVTALNNYYNPGSGNVLRNAVSGGNLYILFARQYATSYPLFADVTAGSNVLTNVTRGDGYAGFMTADLANGDFLFVPPWTNSGPFASGTTITAFDTTAKTITLSNNAAAGTTATKQPFHFWVQG